MTEDQKPALDLLNLLKGFCVSRLVLTCEPDTYGGWEGDNPTPLLDVEFVSSGAGHFIRLRKAEWFSADSLASLGAALDAICSHNDREEERREG